MELIEKWKAKKREKELLKEIEYLNEKVHKLETLLQWERIGYGNTRKLNIREINYKCRVTKEEEQLIGDKAIEYAKESIANNILRVIRTIIQYELMGNDWDGNKIYAGSLWVDTRGKQLELE